uniref:Uncharacterized protein n=1 Tax=Caenorhabditis tropicalis TaxID=1561998 RepID=A0A1I7U0X3_9PELO
MDFVYQKINYFTRLFDSYHRKVQATDTSIKLTKETNEMHQKLIDLTRQKNKLTIDRIKSLHEQIDLRKGNIEYDKKILENLETLANYKRRASSDNSNAPNTNQPTIDQN